MIFNFFEIFVTRQSPSSKRLFHKIPKYAKLYDSKIYGGRVVFEQFCDLTQDVQVNYRKNKIGWFGAETQKYLDYAKHNRTA